MKNNFILYHTKWDCKYHVVKLNRKDIQACNWNISLEELVLLRIVSTKLQVSD
jgi:hypothetical protein